MKARKNHMDMGMSMSISGKRLRKPALPVAIVLVLIISLFAGLGSGYAESGQYNITYSPGVYGVWSDRVFTATDGAATPLFDGNLTSADSDWVFYGWSPHPSPTVSGDAKYTASWCKYSNDSASRTQIITCAINEDLTFILSASGTGQNLRFQMTVTEKNGTPKTSALIGPTGGAIGTFYQDIEFEGIIFRVHVAGNEVQSLQSVMQSGFRHTYEAGLHGSFDTGRKNEYHNGLFASETSPAAPNPVADPGYTFAGWFDGANTYATNADLPKTVTGNKSYTALWVPLQAGYIVLYDADGGFPVPQDQNVYSAGDTVQISNVLPMKNGYDFVGWEASFDSPYILYLPGETFTMPPGNVVLIARWRVIELPYSVEYYYDGVLDPMMTEQLSVQSVYPQVDSVPLNGKDKLGYRLADPPYYPVLPATITYSDNIINVYYIKDVSQAKELRYTVEYYIDGYLYETLQDIKEYVWVLDPDELTVKPVDTSNSRYSGYRFDHTDPSAIPATIGNNGVIKVYYIKDESQTKELRYTVEYYMDGVLYETLPAISTVVWIFDPDELTVQPVDTSDSRYSGYSFDCTDPSAIPVTIGNNGVIKVYYKRDAQPLIYEVAVSGSFANPSGAGSYPAGITVTINAGTRTGYSFNGWTVVSGAAALANNAANSTTFTMPANNVEVTANWLINKYTVTFVDWNGTVLKVHTDIEHGSGAIAPANPTRTGYNFVRWDRAFNNVTSDLTVKAVYTQKTTPPTVDPPPVVPPPVIPPPVIPPPVVPPPVIVDPPEPPGPPPPPPPVDPPPAVEPFEPPVANEIEIDPLPVVQESPHQATLDQLADEGVPILNLGGREVPLAALQGMPAWALLNLILAVLGAVFVAITIFRASVQKRREEEEYDYRAEGEEKRSFRRHIWIIPAIALAVFGIIFFMVTEDINSLMVLLWDQWTIFNIAAFAGVVVTTRLALRDNKGDEEYAADSDAETSFTTATDRI